MLEKGKKFLNICLSTFLLLSIIFLFSVQNVKAEEETDTINPDEIQMSVDSLLTGISSKGFHPSKRNYLSIRAGVSFNTEQDLEGTAINVRLRILNKSGKYVYEQISGAIRSLLLNIKPFALTGTENPQKEMKLGKSPQPTHQMALTKLSFSIM